jgi:myo-inositol 2-dehydrogenase / D-chiro-inositol 1-dehydrogenase
MKKSKDQTVSRRDFIRTSAVAAASVSALGGLGHGFHAAGSDTVRIGMIGCGGQATRNMVSLLKGTTGVELVAMGDMFGDRMEESLEILRKEKPEAIKVKPENRFTGFDNHKGVLQSDVHAVHLTAPPHFRPLHFRAAVDAGKHVFMEKPAGVDPAGIRSILETADLADQKKLSILCGTQRRHAPLYQETIRRIHDGAIGRIVAAEAYWCGSDMLGYWHWYDRGNMSTMEWQCRNWPWYTWLSGDHIVEQHVHNIDVIHWVLGTYPDQCLGMGGRQVRNLGNIYDNFTVVFEYPDNVRVTSLCRQINGCSNRVGERIVGTKGVADVDRGIITGENAWEYEGQDQDAKLLEQVLFIKTIRDGKPMNEAREMAYSTLAAIQGRMSAYTGRALRFDWVLRASKLDFTPPKYEFGELETDPVAMPGQTALV